MMRVLLLEDDQELGDTIRKGLHAFHYTVDWLTKGKDALFALTQANEVFDLLIIDLSLDSDQPKLDGLDIIRTLRTKKIDLPIIILTARDSNTDIVTGLDSGADDYLTKPFDFNVLNSRISALLRRKSQHITDQSIQINDVHLYPKSHKVVVQDLTVAFSRQEFKILHKLMDNQGQVVSREQITQILYGWGDDVDSNTIEVHMHAIRKKLSQALSIKTIRGVGYIIE